MVRSENRLRILVASPSRNGATHMSHVLSEFKEFEVIGLATDLVQVIGRIDMDRPDLVLLSQKFRSHRDSEVLMSLLREEDIRWLELTSRDPNAAADRGVRQEASGLFEIDAGTSAPALAQQIKAVCRNLRSPYKTSLGNEAQNTGRHPLAGKTVLIGASTGGVDCLLQILSGFSAQCPPTLIVQHTGSRFIDSLISLMNRRCPVPVVAAQDGAPLSGGEVTIAGDGAAHLQLDASQPGHGRCVAGPPVSGHRPAVDALFRSALPFATDVVAVLLTGMGRDGAEGLLALRKAGAVTIAQDEATSVVYGMPRVAKEMGGAQYVMGITEIAAVLTGTSKLPRATKGALG